MVCKSGHYFPALYALMTRKTRELYNGVLSKIKELAPEFQPEEVMTDYEQALASACTAIFGENATVVGCFFHYKQSIVRKFRQLGLSAEQQRTEEVQLVLKCLLSLPLLPGNEIAAGLSDVSNSSLILSEDVLPAMVKMQQYIDKQWIKKSGIGKTIVHSFISIINSKSIHN